MTTVALARDAEVRGRPFTHPSHTEEDIRVLEAMRLSLGGRVVGKGRGSGRWSEADGSRHLTVVPDCAALRSSAPAAAVGFFGQAREDVDHTRIVALEGSILRRAAAFPGLLAYDNVSFTGRGQWGNLVVFSSEHGPAHVAADPEHEQAMRLTPAHYHSLRLHRFVLTDGAFGEAPLRWLRTTYVDFDDHPPWRAVRSRG